MNWKSTLFKPKWRNKNVDIRLQSVSTEQDPELISSLLEIAADDEDKRVRAAAVKRLHQLGNILKLYESEQDPDVRQLLEERIRQLAASSNEARPPLDLRIKVVEMTSNRDLIEHLAGHAPEPELRRKALAKVARQGVLGDCAINDSDSGNRQFAASRINQHTTLKRVIEALRKSDKFLHASLQERLHRELLEKADPVAVKTEGVRICSSLERLVLNIDEAKSEELESLHKAWQQISSHTNHDLTERYQRVCDRFAAPKATMPPPRKEPLVEAKTIVEVETDAVPKQVSPPRADENLPRLFSEIRFYVIGNAEQPGTGAVNRFSRNLEKTWRACDHEHSDNQVLYCFAMVLLEDLQTRLEAQRQASEKALEKATKLLTQLETELEQGELHKALKTRATLQLLAKGHGKNREWQKINSRMYSMQPRLRELRDWQHWSNNKVRKRLIAEMEVLPAADLHPDALLDRIKSLQQEWKNLDLSEQIPGDKKFSSAPWMWRKFSAAGHAAFETAKPFLDKRSEIQSRHAQSLATFCAELQQLTQSDPVDWTALSKGLVRGRKKLAELNEVPANQRQKLARKLKAALDKSNTVIQEHYKDVELEKMKLIRAASQLVHLPERSDAITQAKSLQSNWKTAGSLWRSKEQELWNEFRGHLDPLFSELKDQQDSIRAADKDRLAAQKALCAELKDILKNETDLAALQGRIQGLQDSWKDIEQPDRKYVQSFQKMMDEYQQRVDRSQQDQVKANRERLWLKSAMLHELTVTGRTAKGALSKATEKRVSGAWPDDSSGDELERQMDKTCKEILAGNDIRLTAAEIDEMSQQARALCIAMEFLAGLGSPEEDREQRMKYQVDRLAQSMSGEIARQPAHEEALQAEKTWLGLYSLPESEFALYGKRIKQALSAILESI